MTDRPILFNGEMVRAILSGRKTQTRRPMRKQPIGEYGPMSKSLNPGDIYFDPVTRKVYRRGRTYSTLAATLAARAEIPSEFGLPGDRLWVQEAFATIRLHGGVSITAADAAGYPVRSRRKNPSNFWYRADKSPLSETSCNPWPEGNIGRWRPAIDMPRWASRITLEVKRVWVERICAISCEDIAAEGIQGDVYCCPTPTEDPHSARIYFEELWDSIYGKTEHAWENNPWVWACEFKRIEAKK